ncbi:MAG: substrate-binding domain-containing protein, partial [Planctomycetes bacterium]|nr:substrate-binding domain-containing protein [Planctomycetota bacterium]
EIGVIRGSTATPHMKKLEAFEKTLRDAGYRVHIVFSDKQAGCDEMQSPMASLLLQQPAGIALFPGHGQKINETVTALKADNIPVVLIDKFSDEADTVTIDREAGVAEAIRYLHQSGRKNIAYMGSGGQDSRIGGYKRAIAELGIESHSISAPDEPLDEDQRAVVMTEKLLSEWPQCDALQVFSDVMAMSVLRTFHKRGIRVPEDIAVIGFDDRPFAKLASPPLTTVAQPNSGVGTAAAEIILARLESSLPDKPVDRKISTKLIIREST